MNDADYIEREVHEIEIRRRSAELDLRKRSAVYAAYVDLMGTVYGEQARKNGLDQKDRMLIALAMAVGNGKKTAVEWTVSRALNHGASKQMIEDAIEVALLNSGTFAVSNARFAHEVLDYRLKSPAASSGEEESMFEQMGR